MECKAGVYMILNNINGKMYIGSSKDIFKRWEEHKRDLRLNRHHSKHLQRAWNKYNEETFTFEIIECVEDLNLLIEKEQYWIDKHQSADKNKGYNVTPTAGSMLGYQHTEETKEKMSLSHQGFTHSEESKKKISESKKGENHPYFGKELPEEHKKKLSESKKGKTHSDETKRKIGESQLREKHHFYGKTMSDDHKLKISKTLIGKNVGENNPGSKLTEEQVLEIKKLVKYSGLSETEISKKFNISQRTVSKIKNNQTWPHIKLDQEKKLHLTSPIPPSVNHYLGYRSVPQKKNGKTVHIVVPYLTKEAKEYKRLFSLYAKQQVELQQWNIENTRNKHHYMDCIYYFPRIDMDEQNYAKVLSDSLNGIAYIDDNFILTRTNHVFYDSIDPRVVIEIYPVDYIGVFPNQYVLEQFEDNCHSCTRYKNNCSILNNAKEGRIQEEINNLTCSKYKKSKKT